MHSLSTPQEHSSNAAMTSERLPTLPRGVTYWPEFNIVVFAFLLNLPWEFLQVPFFSGMAAAAHWDAIIVCTRATLGDAVIMLFSYWCVAALAGRYWLLRPKLGHLSIMVLVGLAITIVIERLATTTGIWTEQWSYSERMPVLPLLDVGLTPMLQWILLPPLAIWFCKRQLAGAGPPVRDQL